MAIHPIIKNVLPLLAELILKNANNLHYLYWLLGKMSSVLISGSEQNTLEIKYMDKLQSPLFAGGCENNQYLLNLPDHEFLISIYNNPDQGAQLISKMKIHIKDKQHFVQKSIEQQVHNARAALFAVYIKHYRRINLAKHELTRTDDKKPHKKLLAIYEYANHVQMLFAKTKGQGGNCDELYEQIKTNTLFLLTSIKESSFIPIIDCEIDERINTLKLKHSRRKIEKHDFRLLRNIFQACIRFKKIMFAKKQAIEQKQDNEIILRQAIDNYIFNEKKSESDEWIQCMSRQNERGVTRLITYQFIHKFLQKIFDINQIIILSRIYLPYLRKPDIEWSYLDNISATNIQLKEDIGNTYYSIIKTILHSINNEQIIFYLLNLSYQLTDIYYLHHYKFLEILFNNSDLDITFIKYNWFRLYVFKFCENFQLETNSILNQIQD